MDETRKLQLRRVHVLGRSTLIIPNQIVYLVYTKLSIVLLLMYYYWCVIIAVKIIA